MADLENVNVLDNPSTELASRRTGLSFQRTRIAADRTLMAVIRTSLSLIGFGFTIFQFFKRLPKLTGIEDAVRQEAPRNFGLALVGLGVVLLVLGLWYHIRFMSELRKDRGKLISDGLLHGDLPYPVSLTSIIAILLLAIGLLAVFSMVTRSGPFD